MAEKPEPMVDLEMILVKLSDAFTSAAENLQGKFQGNAWKDSPYIYQMPKMHMKVQLTLAFSNNKVKGFFSKTSSGREEEVGSTMEIDVVAVPRPPKEKPRVLEKLPFPPLMEGSDVQELQDRLIEVGFDCPTTGRFDLETQRAVEHFQQQANIHVDGKVGPTTREKLGLD